MGGAILSKSLIQFSIDGQGCVPSLLFDLRPNYGGGNEDNGDLLEQQTGSKLGKEYVKAVYWHPAYLTYMQSTS